MTWNLDKDWDCNSDRRTEFLHDLRFDRGTHQEFKVGDVIQFMTGYNNDLLAQASIKGIDGNDLYVYNDCYWFPIQADDPSRKIVKVQ